MLSILIGPQAFHADLLEMGYYSIWRIELVSLWSIQVGLSTRISKRM
jgi:hypothetical protein